MLRPNIVPLEEYRDEFNKLWKNLWHTSESYRHEKRYSLSLEAFMNLGVSTWVDIGLNLQRWTSCFRKEISYDNLTFEMRDNIEQALKAFVDRELSGKTYMEVE